MELTVHRCWAVRELVRMKRARRLVVRVLHEEMANMGHA